jgi:nucleotide-binding universal stress UspA family protein
MVILAAVDGSDRSENVVSVGYDLAMQYDTKLQVLHVFKEDEAQSRIDTDADYFLSDAEDDAEKIAATAARRTVDDLINVEPIGKVGDPTDVILEEAAERDPRFLVIGGRKRSPVGKALLGSVGQSILLSAECPVVSVRETE